MNPVAAPSSTQKFRLEPARVSADSAWVANDPKIHRAIQIVLVLLFVAVFGMIALASALLRG